MRPRPARSRSHPWPPAADGPGARSTADMQNHHQQRTIRNPNPHLTNVRAGESFHPNALREVFQVGHWAKEVDVPKIAAAKAIVLQAPRNQCWRDCAEVQ